MIADISDPGIVTADRVDEIEAETRHDIMALTKAMAEKAGEAAWCINFQKLKCPKTIPKRTELIN